METRANFFIKMVLNLKNYLHGVYVKQLTERFIHKMKDPQTKKVHHVLEDIKCSRQNVLNLWNYLTIDNLHQYWQKEWKILSPDLIDTV